MVAGGLANISKRTRRSCWVLPELLSTAREAGSEAKNQIGAIKNPDLKQIIHRKFMRYLNDRPYKSISGDECVIP